jgi:hypothetical protein
MLNVRSLYVLGEPIEIGIGDKDNIKIVTARFIKVKEYPRLLDYIPYLELEKYDILQKIKQYNSTMADYFQDKDLLRIIKGLKGTNYELYDMYKEMMIFIFNEDIIPFIKDDSQLNLIRTLVREMNCITHEEKNPNPEIQYYNDLKKLYNERKGNTITFEAMFSSVMMECGLFTNELTIYQLHAMFNRIQQVKQYDRTVLYSSVSDKVTVEPWYKHVEINEKKKVETTTLEELQSRGGDL